MPLRNQKVYIMIKVLLLDYLSFLKTFSHKNRYSEIWILLSMVALLIILMEKHQYRVVVSRSTSWLVTPHVVELNPNSNMGCQKIKVVQSLGDLTANKNVLFKKKIKKSACYYSRTKNLIFWIVTRASTRDYTVCIFDQ